MSDIRKRYLELEKEKRDIIEKALEANKICLDAKRNKLYIDCEKEGHIFRFTDVGPIGHVWYHCNKCGKSKVGSNE